MFTRLSHTLRIRPMVIGLTLYTMLIATTSQAQIFAVDTYRVAQLAQTGNGNTLSADGYYFVADLRTINANDFSAVQLSYPGPGSPVALSTIDPHLFTYTSPVVAAKTTLDTAFPTGTYQFTATKGANSVVTSLSYTSDVYPASLPYLTGTDFTDLQGFNPASAFTFHFSPFASDPLADAQRIDFRILAGGSGSLLVDSGLLNPTTSDFTLAANTLHDGQTYTYQLNYTNYIGEAAPNSEFGGTVNFDEQTLGTFTTATSAVPEPGAVAMLTVFALTGANFLTRRRRSC